MVDMALADPSWHAFAALDAATRMVDTIVRCWWPAARSAGRTRARGLFRAARGETAGEGKTIPNNYWLVRPAPPGPDGEEQLLFQGAVLVRVRGRRRENRARAADEASDSTDRAAPLSPELIAALEEPPSRPGRELCGPPTGRRSPHASGSDDCARPRGRGCHDRSLAVSGVLRPEPGPWASRHNASGAWGCCSSFS